jgi:hypothetical protein
MIEEQATVYEVYEVKTLSLPPIVWQAIDAIANSESDKYQRPNRSAVVREILLGDVKIARQIKILEAVAS